MEKETVKFAIGFVTGRPNVCKIINSYYEDMNEQISRFNKNVKLTIYILYDVEYQHTKVIDFYGIIPQVKRSGIEVKYITPNLIENEKVVLCEEYGFTREETELLLGHGHAKGRNTILYTALKDNNDYLLFWDDDEYPVANIKREDDSIEWKKQDNILMHLNSIENANVTIGYHCGYISPIPYLEHKTKERENILKNYIEAVSNDIINWDKIKEQWDKENGATSAIREIVEGKGLHEIKAVNNGKWVAGSTLCLNLKNIDKIPAFYNPPGARGEDTFFSTRLEDARVLRVPVYHFHDGFLKYPYIMKGNFPKELRKIKVLEDNTGERFYKASLGWVKYKPLYLYITQNERYFDLAKEVCEKLKISVERINDEVMDVDFIDVYEAFNKYSDRVEEHYKEYLKTNEVWDILKYKIKGG